MFLRLALLSFFHVYISRESILAKVREAMTQLGFTSDGGFVPPLKLKFTHLASHPLYSFFFHVSRVC